MTWGWVNDYRIFILGWAMPLRCCPYCIHSWRNHSFFIYFFNRLHFQNIASLKKKKKEQSKNCRHKMQNASHLLQNEALHSKYHKHISKTIICKHLCHNINSCSICVCYIENCVLCFTKSVLWNGKLRLRISVWFYRFGVWFGVWVSGFRNCVTSKDFVCKQLKKTVSWIFSINQLILFKIADWMSVWWLIWFWSSTHWKLNYLSTVVYSPVAAKVISE